MRTVVQVWTTPAYGLLSKMIACVGGECEAHELLELSKVPFPVNVNSFQSFYLYSNQIFRKNFLITLWKVLMMKTTG